MPWRGQSRTYTAAGMFCDSIASNCNNPHFNRVRAGTIKSADSDTAVVKSATGATPHNTDAFQERTPSST